MSPAPFEAPDDDDVATLLTHVGWKWKCASENQRTLVVFQVMCQVNVSNSEGVFYLSVSVTAVLYVHIVLVRKSSQGRRKDEMSSW